MENNKEVYILFGEIENETCVIGVFGTLKKALEKLEKWERDKEKYHCWNCDFDLNSIHPEWYKGIDLTEEDFKSKRCPNCNHYLSYNPMYDEFNIQKYQIDGAKWEFNGIEHESIMVYQAKITTDDTIKERFGYCEEYNLRTPNTKIEIRV